MDCSSHDMSEFQPLCRGVWGPHELKVALAIALLWRMPERFKHDDDFAGSRKSLALFQRTELLPNAVPCPIEAICFDGESIVLRNEASARLGGQQGGALIHFDSAFSCFIAFDHPADRERFLVAVRRRTTLRVVADDEKGDGMTSCMEDR